MFTRSGEGLTHRLREMAFNTYLRQVSLMKFNKYLTYY